jgi:hypothetical protein
LKIKRPKSELVPPPVTCQVDDVFFFILFVIPFQKVKKRGEDNNSGRHR